MKKEMEMEMKIRIEFQSWLAHWNDITWANNHYNNIYMKLFNVYKFGNKYIDLNKFLENHSWKIKDWEEVEYLVRDVELTDNVLKLLPVKIRRNLLAAIHRYEKVDLARYLDCTPSRLTNTFDYLEEYDSKDSILLPLARVLDVPVLSIRYEAIYEDTQTYVEYMDVKTISFLELIPEIDLEPGNIKFLRIKRNQEYFIRPIEEYLYVKIVSYNKFKLIEVMGLNYDSDEKFDLIHYCIRKDVEYIIVTPAILRKIKKVIYVLKSPHEKNSEEMKRYVSTMSKRKFTHIFELGNGSNEYKKMYL